MNRSPQSPNSGSPLSQRERDRGEGDLARLRWRCRRGMRELDVVLQRYLETRYTIAPLAEQQAFERLLDEQDPQLLAYVMGRERPRDPQQANVVERLAHPHV